MPDRPSWADKIPDALEALAHSEEQFVSRQLVESLLGVKPRRANGIIQVAGPVPMGKSLVVEKRDFIEYLKWQGGPELLIADKTRKRELAKRITAMRAEHIQRYVEVPLADKEIISPEDTVAAAMAKKAGRRGLKALPEGIEIGPGFITIRCETGVEGLQKMQALALAVGRSDAEFREFEERVGVSKASPRLAVGQ